MNNIFRKCFAQIVLAADDGLSWYDKLHYILISLSKLAPIAFIFSGLDMWFDTNKIFFTFLVYTLLANIIAGVWRHRKEGSFSWEKFFIKNFQMWMIIIMTYPLLEMLHHITGDNSISEVFSVIIQLSTILYPGSKLLKNVYIISNKQFPPRFIMERLYKFEKTGNTDFIFNKDAPELSEEEKQDFEDSLKEK